MTEKRVMGLLEREGYEVVVYAYREGTVFRGARARAGQVRRGHRGVLPDPRRATKSSR